MVAFWHGQATPHKPLQSADFRAMLRVKGACKAPQEEPMTVTITPANPARPDFVGVVAGIDLKNPVSAADAATIDAGMDHYGVLVFHGQDINDEQQLAFSRNFGPLETATGDIAKVADRRLAMEVNDISNLDKNSNVLARDDRRRLFSLGNMLWHSDSSFKATPAK
jgi:alpha-ketoglutarate-dependent 2,4-dichlorophenoxyacetate dioxygenase